MKPSLKIAYLFQDLNKDFNPDVWSQQDSHLIPALRRAGHEVTILASRWDRQVLYAPDPQSPNSAAHADLAFTRDGVLRLLEVATRRLQSMLGLPWLQLFDSLRMLEASVRNLKGYDVLHERNHMHGIGGALASIWLGIPLIYSVHADFLLEHSYLGISHTRLERWLAGLTAMLNYRVATAIVCVSRATKDHLIRTYRVPAEKIFVIPNGAAPNERIGEEQIIDLKFRLGIDEHPTIGFIGAFYKWHGVESLIEVLSLVLEHMDVCLVLVGDGPERSAIAEQAARRGLSDNVRFAGWVPYSDVPTYLGLIDVAVAPYPPLPQPLWFSPLKLFDYMASGKAIVASGIGQIREVIDDGETGVLVEPGNSFAMANAIVELLCDPSRRRELGENARATLETKYTWDHCVERLETIYQQALTSAKLHSAQVQAM